MQPRIGSGQLSHSYFIALHIRILQMAGATGMAVPVSHNSHLKSLPHDELFNNQVTLLSLKKSDTSLPNPRSNSMEFREVRVR